MDCKMNKNKYVFAQLIEVLNHDKFRKNIGKKNDNVLKYALKKSYSRHFWGHFRCFVANVAPLSR